MKTRKKAWNRKEWTIDEIGFLIVYNNRYTVKEMAEKLGKTIKNVKRKCYCELNLFKSSEANYEHRSNANKKRKTDLSYDYVKAEAAKYNTRVEFWQRSTNAYGKAISMGWIDEVCQHMVSKNFSLPQLMLKSYLEQIFEENCVYNDRLTLKPYEIDCYFPKYKIGWEYNGLRFHKNNKNDKIKKLIAEEKGIRLFYVNEQKNHNYEVFIKSVLKQQINDINCLLSGKKKIDEEYIDNLKIQVDYPNLLTTEEKSLVKGKTINEIKKIDLRLFNRIIRYDLFDKYDIIDDRRKMHYFDTFEEYINYIKAQNYKSFKEALKGQHNHIYRMCRKFNKDVNLIKNIYH